MNGLVAGAKNIGTTHMVNAAYRLHPIEWAIGEAAGTLAAFAASLGKDPRDIFADEPRARELQQRLIGGGAPLYWVDDVPDGTPLWEDVQLVAASGVMAGPELDNLHFRPDGPINRAQGAFALGRALAIPSRVATGQFGDVPATHWAAGAIEELAARGIITTTGSFAPDAPMTAGQLRVMIQLAMGEATARSSVPPTAAGDRALNRGEAAQALVRALRARLHLP